MGCVASAFSRTAAYIESWFKASDPVVVVNQDAKPLTLADKIHEEKDLKVVLVGDSGTGKTSILHRLTYDKFFENLPPTYAFVLCTDTLSSHFFVASCIFTFFF